MYVIIVNSQKGGSGKTTLSAHLAVEAERIGDGPVHIIDTDPQGSLARWHSIREAETPERSELPFDRLAEGLEVLKTRGVAYVIIDTAPVRSDEITDLLKLADLVLVPLKPSKQDAWSAATTVSTLKKEALNFMFVLNMVKPNARITAQTAAALSSHGQVSESFIGDRVAYITSIGEGLTAQEEEPGKLAAREITMLWSDIKDRLKAINSKS